MRIDVIQTVRQKNTYTKGFFTLKKLIYGCVQHLSAKTVLAAGLLMAFMAPASRGAVVTFNNVISGQVSYGFDGDGDSTNDVLFSTTDPGGFNTVGPGTNMNYVHEPGLEGTASLLEDLRVTFLNGAVGNLTFGFALSSGAEGPDVYTAFSVYDSSNNLLGTSTVFGLFTPTPSGQSSFPEGQVNLNFSGVASYATFNFSSGGRYIIDDFTGTFGSTETAQINASQVPEPSTAMLLFLGGGLVAALRRRMQA